MEDRFGEEETRPVEMRFNLSPSAERSQQDTSPCITDFRSELLRLYFVFGFCRRPLHLRHSSETHTHTHCLVTSEHTQSNDGRKYLMTPSFSRHFVHPFFSTSFYLPHPPFPTKNVGLIRLIRRHVHEKPESSVIPDS